MKEIGHLGDIHVDGENIKIDLKQLTCDDVDWT